MFKNIHKTHSGGVLMLASQSGKTFDFLGTGFLASSNGYILTCSHIVNPLATIFAIVLPKANFIPMTLDKVKAEELILVQNDPINDVALLRFKNDVKCIVPDLFGTSETVECGSSIALIGFPFGSVALHVPSITQGIISAKTITSSGVKLLQFDSMIHEGNSGAPLIELATNKIIGIVSNRFNPSSGGPQLISGNRIIGVETNISYATAIEYGIELLNNEIK